MRIHYTPLGVRLTAYTPHYPHPPQEAFLALPLRDTGGADEVLYGGAARGGKSDALLMAALQYIDIPGYSAIILRRESPELYGADGFVELSKEWLTPALGQRAFNTTHLVWTFPSGATLRFGHMQREDDKRDFQGQTFQFVGFDELTHFTESQYRYLFSRLTRPAEGPLSKVPLRMRSSSNPGGPGHEWVKRRFIDKLPDPDDPEDTPEKAAARVFIPAKVADNPSIDRDAYVKSLSYLEPEVRAQLLDGDWDARQPGDWFFDDRHITAITARGRDLHDQLLADTLPDPADGLVHLGIDWGENTHALLGWPLESGGMFIVAEHIATGGEPTESTRAMLRLNSYGLRWGRARYDAAGIQSMRTFKRESQRVLSGRAPVPSKVPFGKFKGEAAMYLRRLARRAHGVWWKGRHEVPEGTEGSAFIPGPLPGYLAVSPACPVLLRQLKLLERDQEAPTGAWLKAEDQHGPDAAIALVAPVARRWRAASEGKPPEKEAVA